MKFLDIWLEVSMAAPRSLFHVLIGVTSGESFGFNDDPCSAAVCHLSATDRFIAGQMWILTFAPPFAWHSFAVALECRKLPMESNQRYYARRASEERTAASRAITAAAREWHAKLANQFAARAAAALEGSASAA